MEVPADHHLVEEGGKKRLVLTGSLSINFVGSLSEHLREIGDIDVIDVSEASHVDTVGAWLIYRTAQQTGAEVVGCSENTGRLIDEIKDAQDEEPQRAKEQIGLIKVVDEIGEAVRLAGSSLLGLLDFFGHMVRSSGTLFLHPSRFRFTETVLRMEIVGVRSLGIIGLMSFLVGIVIAQQGAVQLRQFGAEIYTINLIGRLTFRELGVLMTAIMVAGRSGSAFAAQIGTMRLTEEVDAMRTIGVSPMEALVIPRVFATVFMMPLLAFYASVIAIIGGGLLSWISLGIPPVAYIERIQVVVPFTDFMIALVKAPLFGFIIAITGCFQGMQVRGNAEEVGTRTTTAVVQAIFLVIVLDAFFAIFFSEIGWD